MLSKVQQKNFHWAKREISAMGPPWCCQRTRNAWWRGTHRIWSLAGHQSHGNLRQMALHLSFTFPVYKMAAVATYTPVSLTLYLYFWVQTHALFFIQCVLMYYCHYLFWYFHLIWLGYFPVVFLFGGFLEPEILQSFKPFTTPLFTPHNILTHYQTQTFKGRTRLLGSLPCSPLWAPVPPRHHLGFV